MSADEIIKYKKLLDDGIITQEEFNLKRDQIMGDKPANNAELSKEDEQKLKTFLGIFIIGLGWWMGWMFGVFPPYGSSKSTTTASSSSSQSSSARSSSNWYEGGTLHNASAGEWLSGSSANRLATASDFAASAKDELGFNDMDGMKSAAQGVKNCIDRAAEGDASQQVSTLAATCIMLMK